MISQPIARPHRCRIKDHDIIGHVTINYNFELKQIFKFWILKIFWNLRKAVLYLRWRKIKVNTHYFQPISFLNYSFGSFLVYFFQLGSYLLDLGYHDLQYCFSASLVRLCQYFSTRFQYIPCVTEIQKGLHIQSSPCTAQQLKASPKKKPALIPLSIGRSM